jgi:hypothetical protein
LNAFSVRVGGSEKLASSFLICKISIRIGRIRTGNAALESHTTASIQIKLKITFALVVLGIECSFKLPYRYRELP